jgi:hypothetical protein
MTAARARIATAAFLATDRARPPAVTNCTLLLPPSPPPPRPVPRESPPPLALPPPELPKERCACQACSSPAAAPPLLTLLHCCRPAAAEVGWISTIAGTPGRNGSTGDGDSALAATLDGPAGIVYDPMTASLLVTEINSGKLRVILPDGTILTDTTLPLLGRSWDLAVSANGTLLFAISSGHTVAAPGTASALRLVVGRNGTSGATGDNASASAALLNSPFGIAADASNPNRFWIADAGGWRAWCRGSRACLASAARPSPARPSHSAQLRPPLPFSSPPVGNNRIRLVASGNISSVAGNGTAGFSGDNGPATAARLTNATGVAVDAFGNLFIADSGAFLFPSCLLAVHTAQRLELTNAPPRRPFPLPRSLSRQPPGEARGRCDGQNHHRGRQRHGRLQRRRRPCHFGPAQRAFRRSAGRGQQHLHY